MVIDVISKDMVVVDGVVYKRLKTIGGKYPPEYRRSYMRAWRKDRQKLQRVNKETSAFSLLDDD
jgi:hypothetical protein